MVSTTRRRGRSEKVSNEKYHLAAGNSLVKEGRSKERLTRQEAKSYAAADTKVEIAAARNGHDAFQVFVAAPGGDLKDVTLRKTALINEQTGRKIDLRHISLFVVESVKTRGRKPDIYWPDILWPYKRFDVPKRHLQPVRVSVYVPKGTRAGDYRGQIEVRPLGSPPQTVQVKLTVWDFALPDKTHLATGFGFTTQDTMSRFYDFYPGSPQKQSAMVRKYVQFLHDHRINTLMYGYTVRDPHILSIKEDKRGKLSYDFSKADSYLRFLVERGMRFNIFSPPFWQSGDLLFKLNPLLKERFEHLGERVFDSPEFDKAVTELLESYVKHLRQKGWLKNAFCYIWDEPPANRYDHMCRMCDMVKKVAPEVPRLTTANFEPFDLEGRSDIWCPDLGTSRVGLPGCYDRYGEFYKSRKRAGEEVWWYIAEALRPFPNWLLNYPLVDCRIPYWLTWRYGLDGLVYWNTTAWHYAGKENFKANAADRWPNKPWDPTYFCSIGGKQVYGPGCGQLIYPGPDGPIGSMRLASIRDGIEDYEYLRLLERKIAALAKQRSTPARKKLLRASNRVLAAARRAANKADDWEQDGQKLLALRSKIGLQIEALTCALKK